MKPEDIMRSFSTGEPLRVSSGKLKGVQMPLLTKHPKLAYGVRTPNGRLVLCNEHLDAMRAKGPAPLTGKTFAVELCDHCHPEES